MCPFAWPAGKQQSSQLGSGPPYLWPLEGALRGLTQFCVLTLFLPNTLASPVLGSVLQPGHMCPIGLSWRNAEHTRALQQGSWCKNPSAEKVSVLAEPHKARSHPRDPELV